MWLALSPRGALSARVINTAPAPDGDGRRESVCAGRRGGGRGVAEQWGGRWRLVCSQARGDRSCLIGIKSDMLIRMVALTVNVDFRAGPGQSQVGHSSRAVEMPKQYLYYPPLYHMITFSSLSALSPEKSLKAHIRYTCVYACKICTGLRAFDAHPPSE